MWARTRAGPDVWGLTPEGPGPLAVLWFAPGICTRPQNVGDSPGLPGPSLNTHGLLPRIAYLGVLAPKT